MGCEMEMCCSAIGLKAANILMGCFSAVLCAIGMIVLTLIAYLDEAFTNEHFSICVIVVCMFLGKFILDLLFIYGVALKKSVIIRAYFVLWSVYFILVMFIFYVTFTSYNAALSCSVVFYICINIYGILLSYSYYKVLVTTHEEL